MSVQRSPTSRPITSAHRDEPIAFHNSGGSQPDLRQLQLLEFENQQVTLRNKRKLPDDDFSQKFEDFQNKIMTILTTTAETQNEKLNAISHDITAIREEICQIKLTTNTLALEQKKLQKEVEQITKFNNDTEMKIKAIEDEIQSFKALKTQQTPFNYENIIAEMHERTQRERNVIISGIVEINSKNFEERQSHDKSEVAKVLKPFVANYADPVKVFRLGKYDEKKSRPIKVCFASPATAKSIFRNKSAITERSKEIKIYSDETPLQKETLKKLRDELKRRTENGENDLTIKFTKGMPKILKSTSNSKN